MALERRGGGLYYYRSVRVAGRVVKRYGGNGYVATLSARYDQLVAEERSLKRRMAQQRADWRWQRLKKVFELVHRANRLAGEALRASGWHQHNREWRKKRGATMAANLATMIDSWVPDRIRAEAGTLDSVTAKAAQAGDRSCLPAVQAYLGNPAAVALWGDSGRRMLECWVRKYAGGDLLTEEAMLRFASELRSGLVGADPDPLVRLLAERVVLAWVVSSFFERCYVTALEKSAALVAHKYFQRSVDFAHRQLLASARTLAKVRRAKLPEVLAMVNVSAPTTVES